LKDVRQRIRWRMKDLAREGKVQRHHMVSETGHILGGRWTLASTDG
jgi:hypothetical protein